MEERGARYSYLYFIVFKIIVILFKIRTCWKIMQNIFQNNPKRSIWDKYFVGYTAHFQWTTSAHWL